MISLPTHLKSAFCATNYCTEHDTLRIAEANNRQHAFAIITAYNPQATKRDDASNQLADQRLQRWLLNGGWSIERVSATSQDNSWPIEHGWLIHAMSLKLATALGQHLHQAAIVYQHRGELLALIWLSN